MATYILYSSLIAHADSFWSGYHIAILWLMGISLDLMLLLVLYVALNAVLAAGTSLRALAARARLLRLAGGMSTVDRLSLLLASLFLAALVLVTTVSVIGRALYKPIPDDITFAEWSMVALVALMLGFLQGADEHIEVTALSDRFSLRVNLGLRFLALCIGLAGVGRLLYVSLEYVPDSFLEVTYGSIYDLPLWPPRLVFMLGIAWWVTRIAIQLFLVPLFFRLQALDEGNGFNPVPLASRTGQGVGELGEDFGPEGPSVGEAAITGGRDGA